MTKKFVHLVEAIVKATSYEYGHLKGIKKSFVALLFTMQMNWILSVRNQMNINVI